MHNSPARVHRRTGELRERDEDIISIDQSITREQVVSWYLASHIPRRCETRYSTLFYYTAPHNQTQPLDRNKNALYLFSVRGRRTHRLHQLHSDLRLAYQIVKRDLFICGVGGADVAGQSKYSHRDLQRLG